MQKYLNIILYIALIVAIVFGYVQYKKNISLSESLSENNKQQTRGLDKGSLQKKIDALEEENKLLKDQIFQLEKQQFLFKSNQANEEKYKLEENLKFKDEVKDLKEVPSESKKEDDYKISPSIEFNKEKRTIDGVNIELKTKF